jgi:hypothetical protein
LAHLTPFAAQPTRRVVPTDGPNGVVAVVVNKSPLSLVDGPHCQSRLQHRSLGRARDTGSPLTGAVSRWPELLLLRALVRTRCRCLSDARAGSWDPLPGASPTSALMRTSHRAGKKIPGLSPSALGVVTTCADLCGWDWVHK